MVSRPIRATFAVIGFIVLTSVLTQVASGQDRITLVGSGSNLPRPLYDAWAAAFNQRNAKIQVQYLSIGTVESIKQISKGSGDFGGGEVQLTGDLLDGAQAELAVLPVALVGVVPIYNLPGTGGELRFSGEVLADIYLGKVRSWNDPELVRLNPGVKLPEVEIQVFHRSPGKGTDFILSDFLSKISPTFRQKIGKSASPKWVLGRSAMRNEDMAEGVAGTPGAIGYVELNYAARGVSVGSVQNAAGRFVKASKRTVENACAAVIPSRMQNLQVSLTNAPGRDAYPLSSFTYVYLRRSMHDRARARALYDFLEFALGEGQQIAANKNYAPLPKPVLEKVRSRLHELAAGTGKRN